MNRSWLYASLVLAAVLLRVHVYALSKFWYWYYRWFDIPMHILGGITLGAFLLGIGITRARQYFLCMLAVVVAWEVFEYVTGISTGQPNYWFDTIKDMVDGLVGSAVAYGVSRYTPPKRRARKLSV